jgi:hypothetical protein
MRAGGKRLTEAAGSHHFSSNMSAKIYRTAVKSVGDSGALVS